jgi:hypothetical protein
MCREQERLAKQHATAKWKKEVPKDSEPDLCPIKILATQFLYERGTAFDRVDLYRQRLERQMHTILRELRKLRDEMGDEAEPWEECSGKTEPTETENPILKTEPTEHGRDAHATEGIRKSEPTIEDNSLPQQEKRSPEEPEIARLNGEPAGIQSRDPN